MTFKNEYIPPVEQETSEFFKAARTKFNTGYSKHDKWTIDREREMVLSHLGSGREMESADEDFWALVDHTGTYEFDTKRLRKDEVSPQEVAITCELKRFWAGSGHITPTAASFAFIKEALREFKVLGLLSDYTQCQLTLIDGATGREI